jgi:hypothetical protein
VAKTLTGSIWLGLVFISAGARAQELDTVLPEGIPGYGTPFGVISASRQRPPTPPGFLLGDAMLSPSLMLGGGYDSAPGDAVGSAFGSLAPSLTLSDSIIGLGAYAAANSTQYPENEAQDLHGAVAALGERMVLPEETITLAAGWLAARESAFALDATGTVRPPSYEVRDVRASDEISAGLFAITPEVSASWLSLPAFPAADRTDVAGGVTAALRPGGPVQFVLRLRGLDSRDRDATLSAATSQALLGVLDQASGIWAVSALAGVAQRSPRVGEQISAPVLEWRLDWLPFLRDRMRATLAREIDDPDEIAATPYILNEAKLVLEHRLPEGGLLTLSSDVEGAAYLSSPRRATLVREAARLDWPVSPALAFDAAYNFNGRQANFLRAATEHVVTLGVTWTP